MCCKVQGGCETKKTENHLRSKKSSARDRYSKNEEEIVEGVNALGNPERQWEYIAFSN